VFWHFCSHGGNGSAEFVFGGFNPTAQQANGADAPLNKDGARLIRDVGLTDQIDLP
jgi:hypothetical protein